ncbi:unnamed protein product [Leptosia nina]|uniref:Fucosyltransferase n=1 Tax=Leptosia nina TaxID=320188 RepID=A0AAV1JCX2_9NEOP
MQIHQTIKLFVKMLLREMKKFLKVLIVLCVLLVLWFWDRSDKVQEHLLPVILWWTNGFPGTQEIRYCPEDITCRVRSDKFAMQNNIDAYLFYASNINFNELPLPRNAKKVIWGLYHEESPRNVEELSHEQTLSLFNFSSTFSRYSDVPFPLQYLDSIEDVTSKRYFVPTDVKNSHLNMSPILYLQTDCETATERDAYAKELMKYINIDSYGACLKNKEMPAKFTKDYLNHLNDDDFLHFIARYKFVLAIENGVCDDYITEKFWRAIKVGTVPIYFGSPTIREWLPNEKSAILLEDYPTPEVMSKYIKKLLKDDSLYEKHLEHKIYDFISNERLVNELKSRPYQVDALRVAEKFECFVCKKLHDLKSGVLKESVLTKYHYNCPEPISALTLKVNPHNGWVFSWQYAKKRANKIQQTVLGTN